MSLSVSNIAWESRDDEKAFALMKKIGFLGLEIAPTRICENPYENLECVMKWRNEVAAKWGFEIPSMQSIFFGRAENIFQSTAERNALLNYAQKTVDFAAAIGCKNLVFGCPKNRNVPPNLSSSDAEKIALEFFRKIADFAEMKNCVIGFEANPAIYGTNFCNTTAEALDFVKKVNRAAFKLNFDLGAVLAAGDTCEILRGNIDFVSHVHISEMRLAPIQKREIHRDLRKILEAEGYSRFVSIEMAKTDDIADLQNAMEYVREVFL